MYYDTVSKSSDILEEINNIKSKSLTNDFLEEIFETEDLSEISTRTTTTTKVLSPDDLGLIKDGYNNMKRFLDTIEDKKENIFVSKNL